MTPQEVKNKITDRIHINHERAIDGEELQEMLHDIVDCLVAFSPSYSVLVSFPLENVTGEQEIDVTGYEDDWQILYATVKLMSGIGGSITAGLTEGGGDVIMYTDLSYLTTGSKPEPIQCAKVLDGSTKVYFNLTGSAIYSLYLILIRMK